MKRMLVEVRRGLIADGPILAGIAAAWALSVAMLGTIGINGLALPAYRENLVLYIAALFVLFVAGLLLVLARHRPERPIGFLFAAFKDSALASRLVRGVPMLAALVMFLPIFSKMKAAIPRFNAYTWDSTWIALDRALHVTDPWRLLQPLVGYPAITAILAVFYHAWILLLYLGATYFCFLHADRALRAQFFIAYFACWAILGVVLATAFASVGPCFVGPILGDPRFDEQMAYLRDANEVYPVMVLRVQELLLERYQAAGTGLGSGITAMPSMHVSIAVLFALAVGQASRVLGIFSWLFAGIILIGSVHLAYHYAVDGYVSIIGTWLIWLAAGPLARRITRERGSPPPPVDQALAANS
jgi:hypothetical protein